MVTSTHAHTPIFIPSTTTINGGALPLLLFPTHAPYTCSPTLQLHARRDRNPLLWHLCAGFAIYRTTFGNYRGLWRALMRPLAAPHHYHTHIHAVAPKKRTCPAKRAPRPDVVPDGTLKRFERIVYAQNCSVAIENGRTCPLQIPPYPKCLRDNSYGRQSCRATPNTTTGFGHPPPKKHRSR